MTRTEQLLATLTGRGAATAVDLESDDVTVSSGFVVRGVYNDRVPDVPTICVRFYEDDRRTLLKRLAEVDPEAVHCYTPAPGILTLRIETGQHAVVIRFSAKYTEVTAKEAWALQLLYNAGHTIYVRTILVHTADGSILTDSGVRRVDAISSILPPLSCTRH